MDEHLRKESNHSQRLVTRVRCSPLVSDIRGVVEVFWQLGKRDCDAKAALPATFLTPPNFHRPRRS